MREAGRHWAHALSGIIAQHEDRAKECVRIAEALADALGFEEQERRPRCNIAASMAPHCPRPRWSSPELTGSGYLRDGKWVQAGSAP